MRLLCDAIPFCYGPAAALEAFLTAFFDASTEAPLVDVLASGSTAELLRRAKLPIRLLNIDSEDVQKLEHVPFAFYDAFFNVCNPTSYAVARRSSVRIVYLDFLLWMHTGSKPAHFDADLYLAENYPGTEEWVAGRGPEIPKLVVVPPLITTAARTAPQRGFLLVGLGGLYSRLTIPGRNNNYATLVVRQVLESIPDGRFTKVLIAGPERLRPILSDLIAPYPHVEYASLSHEDFVMTLSRAELFVSHPGLYAAFEAMLMGVPTAFLPPSNYTQVLQLRHYRAAGLAESSFSWEDAGLDRVPAGLPEADGVHAVLHVVTAAEHSAAASTLLRRMLLDFFLRDEAALQALSERQRRRASAFGTDGAETAAGRFLAWFAPGAGLRLGRREAP